MQVLNFYDVVMRSTYDASVISTTHTNLPSISCKIMVIN